MKRLWAISIAVLWGATGWADPPPILPGFPADTSPASSAHKKEKMRSATEADNASAPRAPATAPPASAEPQPASGTNPAAEEATGSDEPASRETQPPEPGASGVVLDFRTRELMELKRIARELGGNLVITIEPRGISPADLIIPLKSSGLFEVSSKDGKTFLVTSNGEGQKREMEREIGALARRQAALLRNIEVLEAMRAEGRIPDPTGGQGQGDKSSVAEQESPPSTPPQAGGSEYALPTR
ncbi:hypothetical protein [Methylacidimicrobium sp. B4]|uniref:hypothetical protein n=1 Tax=Methylacidimicrobium sp. B4 TaxID=2796139 RepID=UPI001A8FD048|nr:hypothetical protein [Methylacidimicrobium sp. B4]QSR85034.1 hypothetical protein MacB4_01830 [Methylacidimicrobium sp. B4]